MKREKIVVLGGARSGKSTFAEEWAATAAGDGRPVLYVATARPRPGDAEWDERVRRHRAQRPSSWETRETTDVAQVLRTGSGTVIVECLSLWLTAVLDDVGAWEDSDRPHAEVRSAVDDAVDELVSAWRASEARIVAVSNEVGWGVVPASSSGRLFRDLLGTVNRRIAAEADRAVLCVAGRQLELTAAPGGAAAQPPRSATVTPAASASELPTVRATAVIDDRASDGSGGRLEPGLTGVAAPVDRSVERVARERVDGLAKPPGSLGRLEEIGIWLATRQGQYPPRSPEAVRVTVIAGDHGVAGDVSAYPAAVTGAMVRTVVDGSAAVNALARAHGAQVRVRDLSVDADLTDVEPEVTRHKVRRGTGRIDREDSCELAEIRAAVVAGRELAAADAAADLLIVGDLGIGNTTAAAALIGTVLGADPHVVTGRGTGIDDETLRRKTDVVAAAIDRGRTVRTDPEALLAAVAGPDLAAMAGFLAGAAELGVPVLLDGVVVTAAALVAAEMTPGAGDWWLAGHRSVEPAHAAALDHLRLVPIVDLGMRLGEGTGALAALPMLRSAAAVCREMAALADLSLG